MIQTIGACKPNSGNKQGVKATIYEPAAYLLVSFILNYRICSWLSAQCTSLQMQLNGISSVSGSHFSHTTSKFDQTNKQTMRQ